MAEPSMDPRPNTLIMTVVCALCVGCATPASTQEAAPYPVWWSPSLELESLDKIDERLERKFWPNSSGGIPVVKGEWPGDTEAVIDSCASYYKLSEEGYYARYNNDAQVLQFQSTICEVIEMLRDTKPSRQSNVDQVVLGPAALDFLPAMIRPSASCDFLCRQQCANARAISWRDFEVGEFLGVEVIHEYRMVVTTTSERVDIEIFARADFNNDGMEDLLVEVNAGATGGTWGTILKFLLTRDEPDAVLRVLNANQHLCPDVMNYRCEEHYDYPEILKNTY